MRLSFLTFLFCIAFVLITFAQSKDATQNMKAQAGKMASAFLKDDYKTFARYTYPLIVKAMGGADKMADVLSKGRAGMKAQGAIISNITFDEPSKIIKAGKELQATIPQHTEIKLTQGRLLNTSTLIAISEDNGANWTFIDTSNKDRQTLNKVLPNLSPSIVIPPAQPPVKYDD